MIKYTHCARMRKCMEMQQCAVVIWFVCRSFSNQIRWPLQEREDTNNMNKINKNEVNMRLKKTSWILIGRKKTRQNAHYFLFEFLHSIRFSDTPPLRCCTLQICLHKNPDIHLFNLVYLFDTGWHCCSSSLRLFSLIVKCKLTITITWLLQIAKRLFLPAIVVENWVSLNS